MKLMTVISNKQYVVFLEEIGQEGKTKAREVIKKTHGLNNCRVTEAIQYAPNLITPGVVYDRTKGQACEPIDVGGSR